MNYNYSGLNQGSELVENNNFIVLICDVDDIRGRVRQRGKHFNEKQIKEIYDKARRRMADYLMEDFWASMDILIDDVKERTKHGN